MAACRNVQEFCKPFMSQDCIAVGCVPPTFQRPPLYVSTRWVCPMSVSNGGGGSHVPMYYNGQRNRMTDICENITCTQLRLWAVIIAKNCLFFFQNSSFTKNKKTCLYSWTLKNKLCTLLFKNSSFYPIHAISIDLELIRFPFNNLMQVWVRSSWNFSAHTGQLYLLV